MEKIKLFYSLVKALLYIALAIVLIANILEDQPLSREAKMIIIVLALLEAIILIRKIDNRKND